MTSKPLAQSPVVGALGAGWAAEEGGGEGGDDEEPAADAEEPGHGADEQSGGEVWATRSGGHDS